MKTWYEIMYVDSKGVEAIYLERTDSLKKAEEIRKKAGTMKNLESVIFFCTREPLERTQ